MAIITGTTANDTLLGTAADDTINGLAGADTMIGGYGNDTYYVDNIGDVVSETTVGILGGTDTVNSSVNYTLDANVENLTLTGAAAINGTGNALNNTLTGNSAINTLAGGLGNDTYVIQTVTDIVVENLDEGTDTVISGVSYTLGANVENLTLSSEVHINGTGNELNNVLTVSDGNYYGANNVLNGGAGADTMSGRNGSDTYYVDNAGDVVIESVDAVYGGTDTVISTINYTLGAYVENLTLSGVDNLNGTGNALNNVIMGNAGNNVLNGGLGNDSLSGGAGADIFAFNTTLGATNVDSIVGFAGDTIQLSSAIFGGIGATGVLSAAAFGSGAGLTAAATVDQHILYNTTSGGLYYDADGAGGVASVQFAMLVGVPPVTDTDFIVV